MPPSAAPQDVFRVRRWRLRHAQPAGVAHSVPARVERVLRRELPSALAALDVSDRPDRRMVFIRHLTLNFDLNADWGDGRIAAVLGASLTRAVTRALRDATDRPDVVVFENPEAHLASYLAARAGALSGRDWLFAEFEGLHAATASIAIRTLAARDPPKWLVALGTLGPRPRRQVLAALATGDARRILECLATSGASAMSAPVDVTLARRLITRLRGDVVAHAGPASEGAPDVILRTLTRLVRLAAEEIDAPIAALARATLAFTILEQEVRPTAGAPVASSSNPTEATTTREGYGDTLLACVQPWLERRVRRILSASLDHAAARRTHPDGIDEASRSSPLGLPTRFGGAFLLLPFVPDVPLADESDLDDEEVPSPAAIARFVVLRYCQGERGYDFSHDALWRDLCGIPPALSEQRLMRWLERPFDVALWTRESRVELMQRPRCSRRLPTEVLIPLDDRRVVLSLDLETGYWISLSTGDGGAAPHAPGAPVAAPDRIHRLRRDVEFLAPAFGPAFPTPRHAALAVVAHNVLRTFAARLRGFGAASLEHLQTNFLAGAGVLAETERGLEAIVQPPPLHVLLSMSSLLNRPHHPAWLGGRSLTLSLDPS